MDWGLPLQLAHGGGLAGLSALGLIQEVSAQVMILNALKTSARELAVVCVGSVHASPRVPSPLTWAQAAFSQARVDNAELAAAASAAAQLLAAAALQATPSACMAPSYVALPRSGVTAWPGARRVPPLAACRLITGALMHCVRPARGVDGRPRARVTPPDASASCSATPPPASLPRLVPAPPRDPASSGPPKM
jgi:hypothetical protein